jgi:hypothetical protein
MQSKDYQAGSVLTTVRNERQIDFVEMTHHVARWALHYKLRERLSFVADRSDFHRSSRVLEPRRPHSHSITYCRAKAGHSGSKAISQHFCAWLCAP